MYKDDKFFDKNGVTYESLKAMTLFASSGNQDKIEKSLKKLVKDNGYTHDEGTDNEIFFVSSKNWETPYMYGRISAGKYLQTCRRVIIFLVQFSLIDGAHRKAWSSSPNRNLSPFMFQTHQV